MKSKFRSFMRVIVFFSFFSLFSLEAKACFRFFCPSFCLEYVQSFFMSSDFCKLSWFEESKLQKVPDLDLLGDLRTLKRGDIKRLIKNSRRLRKKLLREILADLKLDSIQSPRRLLAALTAYEVVYRDTMGGITYQSTMSSLSDLIERQTSRRFWDSIHQNNGDLENQIKGNSFSLAHQDSRESFEDADEMTELKSFTFRKGNYSHISPLEWETNSSTPLSSPPNSPSISSSKIHSRESSIASDLNSNDQQLKVSLDVVLTDAPREDSGYQEFVPSPLTSLPASKAVEDYIDQYGIWFKSGSPVTKEFSSQLQDAIHRAKSECIEKIDDHFKFHKGRIPGSNPFPAIKAILHLAKIASYQVTPALYELDQDESDTYILIRHAEILSNLFTLWLLRNDWGQSLREIAFEAQLSSLSSLTDDQIKERLNHFYNLFERDPKTPKSYSEVIRESIRRVLQEKSGIPGFRD